MATAFLFLIPLMPGLLALSTEPGIFFLFSTPWAAITCINFLLSRSILFKKCLLVTVFYLNKIFVGITHFYSQSKGTLSHRVVF